MGKKFNNLLEEDKQAEKKKHFQNLLKIRTNLQKQKEFQFQLVKEFNKIASKTQKYEAIELVKYSSSDEN